MKNQILGTSIALMMSCSVIAADQPNILLILSDNQYAGLLGAYGNPDIMTTNIDQLAEQGTNKT